MGISTAAQQVVDDLMVEAIVWDHTQMHGISAQRWAEIRAEYPDLGNGGGGFRIADADTLSRDAAHRHKMALVVNIEGGIVLRVYRMAEQQLYDQISQALVEYFPTNEDLMKFLSQPRSGGKKFLRSMFQKPQNLGETQEIFLSGAKTSVKIDRTGMLHHNDGRYAGRITSITHLRVRPSGDVWFRATSKSGRATWKKVR